MNINNSNLEFRKVKSLKFLYEVNENGTIFRNVKSKKQIKIFLDTRHSPKGYYASYVCIKGVVKKVMIHKIVAECWLGNRPEGYQIEHMDRNSLNNDYRNLRYITYNEQIKNRNLSKETNKRIRKDCSNYIVNVLSKPVSIEKDGEIKNFPSKKQAAEYINSIEHVGFKRIYSRIKKCRSNVFGYNITYLNAETRRNDATA